MRKLALSVAVFASLAIGGLAPSVAFAQAATPTPTPPAQTDTTQNPDGQTTPSGIQENLCAGVNLDVNSTCRSGGITDDQAKERINKIVHSIINIFSLIVGFVSVIMIIIGGLKYITSGGDSSNISGAKNTIIYAIIGIVIVALSQFIVSFVLTRIVE